MLREPPDNMDIVTTRTSLVFDDITKELLGRGKNLQFKAHGTSMFPFVTNGDCVVIKPENYGDVKVGDIILYRNHWGNYIVHRVIKKNGQAALITRGDNMPGYDPPVPNKCVMGRVIQTESRGKQLKLSGWPYRLYSCFIARFYRVRFRGQVRLTRILGRLYWLIEGRRIK
jgi:signal peptidase I